VTVTFDCPESQESIPWTSRELGVPFVYGQLESDKRLEMEIKGLTLDGL